MSREHAQCSFQRISAGSPLALLTSELGHSLWGAILGTVGCGAASLSPTHWMPDASIMMTTDALDMGMRGQNRPG